MTASRAASETRCRNKPGWDIAALREDVFGKYTPPRQSSRPRDSRYALRIAYFLALFEAMIVSYRDKRTRDFAEGKRVKAFEGIHRKAEMKLDQLDAATVDHGPEPSGEPARSLKGDRKGQYSIRINDQWRICFAWPEKSAGPTDVEIVDYH